MPLITIWAPTVAFPNGPFGRTRFLLLFSGRSLNGGPAEFMEFLASSRFNDPPSRSTAESDDPSAQHLDHDLAARVIEVRWQSMQTPVAGGQLPAVARRSSSRNFASTRPSTGKQCEYPQPRAMDSVSGLKRPKG